MRLTRGFMKNCEEYAQIKKTNEEVFRGKRNSKECVANNPSHITRKSFTIYRTKAEERGILFQPI